MPFCSKCGADVTGVSLCPKCGASTAAPESPSSAGTGEAGSPSEAAGSASEASSSASAASGTASGASSANQSAGAPSAPAAKADVSENVAAALAYITPVAIVLLLVDPYKTNRFVRFHSFQSILFFVATLIIWIGLAIVGGIFSVAGIGFLLGIIIPIYQLAVFIVWVLLLVKAFQNQTYRLPLIGELAQKQV